MVLQKRGKIEPIRVGIASQNRVICHKKDVKRGGYATKGDKSTYI